MRLAGGGNAAILNAVLQEENRAELFSCIRLIDEHGTCLHQVIVLLSDQADDRFKQGVAWAYKSSHRLLVDLRFFEADAFVLFLNRRAGPDLPVPFANDHRNMCQLPATLLAFFDLSAKCLEGFDEEALNVMRLESLRFGPLHLKPELVNLGRRHRIIGQRAPFEQIQKMLLIHGAVHDLKELRLDLFLLAILNSFKQEVTQRGAFEQLSQDVVDPSSQSFPCRFELLEEARVDLALSCVSRDKVPKVADLSLPNPVDAPEADRAVCASRQL